VKRIIFSLVIVFMLVMTAVLAANLPPARAQPDPLKLECLINPNPTEAGNVTDFLAAASDGNPPYSWSWTVNGTEVATTQNTNHIFDTGGNYTVCINVTDSSDNWKRCCTNVTVNEDLSLECWVSPDPTKVGHVTNFTTEASGGVPSYSWSWTVNGTEVATTQNTTHIFATAGNYTVCVNVTDSLGNWTRCCTNVTVNEALSLECWVSPETTKVGHVTNFTAAASGGVPSYSWSWTVNGTPVAATQNTTHIFATAGNYTVCVNVTDSLDNKEQCCTNVTVNEALSLECWVSPNTTKVGHITNFTAEASGGVLNYTWLWTVNGAPVPGSQNTTHNFTVDGLYNVCVNVTDSLGNKEQCCTNVTVNPPLSLECWISPETTKVGHVTNFTAAASGGVPPYSWLWTVNGAPVPGAQNTTHNFTVDGLYNVCVNVTDSLGNKDQCCTNVTVNPPLSLECWVSPNTTKVGHVTNFTAGASGGVGNYTWLWTVNGVPVPGGQNTTHNFTVDGLYNVCVNVTDSLDNKEQCCTNVTVNPPLRLECVISPNPTEVGHVTNFTAAAGGGVPPYSWLWTVNGTGVKTDQNTTYTFNTIGNYTVCVNVTDSLDNKEQCCTNVTIIGALNLTCDVSPNPTKVGHVTNFTAVASGGVGNYSYAWDFGDGVGNSTEEDPTYAYTKAGNYTVCVNVTDSSEPENEKQCCTNVTVNERLTMECDVGPTTTKVGNTINGTAGASGGVPPYDWLWTVNGTELASFNNTAFTNITHVFNETGVYEVCVNVIDSLGNEHPCCTNVTVNPALSLVLLPKTDTNLVGTFHVITATLYDQFDDPMPFVNLTWNISGFGNFSGTPGGITNGGGQATAEITSSQSGTSTVRCEVTGNTSVNDTAYKTWYARVPPRGGGGGGCPPIKYLTVDWDGNNVTRRLLGNDELSLDLLGPSPDGCHSLWLEQGTNAPTVDGETYYLIVIRELEETPPLPENTIAIVAVEINPTGAVFNKDIILTLCFDQLPENALEGTLTVAYYDGVSGVWVPLKSTQGERDGMLTISTTLRHFTIFAVLVELAPTPPPPAHFVPSGLSIVTSVERIWETVTFVTKTGESVTISANIANDGGQGGTDTVELKLDGEAVDTEIVTLGAGQSQQVSFILSEMDYGQHEVEVAGLSGEFTTSRTITWWLIIVIIVAIGLIIWGVVWWRRRRKARQAA